MVDFENPTPTVEASTQEVSNLLPENELGSGSPPNVEELLENEGTESPEKPDILLQLGFPPERCVFFSQEMIEVAHRALEALNLASHSPLDFDALSQCATQSGLDIAVSEVDQQDNRTEAEGELQ